MLAGVVGPRLRARVGCRRRRLGALAAGRGCGCGQVYLYHVSLWRARAKRVCVRRLACVSICPPAGRLAAARCSPLGSASGAIGQGRNRARAKFARLTASGQVYQAKRIVGVAFIAPVVVVARACARSK